MDATLPVDTACASASRNVIRSARVLRWRVIIRLL